MKCQIPQIVWHGRDPVLSVDFQMCNDSPMRLATGGTDSHVLIWYVSLTSSNSISLEFASDLNRHSKPVNVVRFSPNGEMLASGDDESIIILWKLSEREMNECFNDEENVNKEQWCPMKMLRGHLDDICDISWSPDSNFLLSGSVDNTTIIWEALKGKKINLLSEYSGFVQGVAWDPQNQYLASLSSDRILRIHSMTGKKVLHKVQKAAVTNSSEKPSNKAAKLFYDDTLKSFCRRLCFSTDGELLIVPTGIIDQEDGKFQNTTYVFSRCMINKPVLHLPTGSKYTLAARCSPILYKLRERNDLKNSSENTDNNAVSLFDLPYRLVFAVATEDSVLFYDTQQPMPFAHVSNIHYTHLTDLAWSRDGQVLIASSTDGYCSFVIFNEGEIGEPYVINQDVEGSSGNIRVPNTPHISIDAKNVKPADKTSISPGIEKSTPSSLSSVISKDLQSSEVLAETNSTPVKSASTSKKNSIEIYLSKTKGKEDSVSLKKFPKNSDVSDIVEDMECDNEVIDSQNVSKMTKSVETQGIKHIQGKVISVKEDVSVDVLPELESTKSTSPVTAFKPLIISNDQALSSRNSIEKEKVEIIFLGLKVAETSVVKEVDLISKSEPSSNMRTSNLANPSIKTPEKSGEKKVGRRVQLTTLAGPKKI